MKMKKLNDGMNLTEKKKKKKKRCLLHVSSLCLCPADLADRKPASCACCETPNEPAPAASRSVGTHKKKKKKKNKKQKIKCSVIKLEQAKQVYRGRDQLTDLNKDEGNKCNGPFNLPVQQKQHR